MKKFLASIVLLFSTNLYAAEVYDNAGLFSDSTKDKVVRELNDYESRGGVNTIVETFPSSKRDNFRSSRDKDEYFDAWIRAAANDRSASGVYILLCKTPGRLQVISHNNAGLSQRDRDSIKNPALRQLKDHNFDAALVALASEVQAVKPVRVRESRQPVAHKAQAQPVQEVNQDEGGNGFIIFLIIVCGIVGVGACIALIACWYNSCSSERYSGCYTSSSRVTGSGVRPAVCGSGGTTVVNNGGSHTSDLLLAGGLGYLAGSHSSSPSHSTPASPTPPPSYTPSSYEGTREDSYGGSSGSDYDSGSSYSSDNGSSYSGSSGGDFGGGFDGGSSGGDF